MLLIAHRREWIPMRLTSQARDGRSRVCPQRAFPFAGAFITALIIPFRLFAHAVYHRDTHLWKWESRYLPSLNTKWRECRVKLNTAQSYEVDRACSVIREIGDRIIVPLLRSVEAEEQGRRLVNFDKRFKDTNRLKHKVANHLRLAPGYTPTEGLAAIHDAVRFTLQYEETGYAVGVQKDMKRFGDRGLILVALRNTWTDDQYKGINTRWRESTSGMLFEVQFHTYASLAARELTHKAYERIRCDFVEGKEMARLREFQRQVNAMVPIPVGVVDIEE